jgi:hypothetical protein
MRICLALADQYNLSRHVIVLRRRWFALNRRDLADQVDMYSLFIFPLVYTGSFGYYIAMALRHREKTQKLGITKACEARPPISTVITVTVQPKEKVHPVPAS